MKYGHTPGFIALNRVDRAWADALIISAIDPSQIWYIQTKNEPEIRWNFHKNKSMHQITLMVR